jgi:quercetin dioxygenase-like cupin family protein
VTAIQASRHDDLRPGWACPSVAVDGTVRSDRFQPEGTALWVVAVELAAGASASWGAAHDDEAVWIRSGRVEVDGATWGPGAAVVVEAGVEAHLVVLDDAELVHVGSSERSHATSLVGPPAPGREIHAMADVTRLPALGGEPVIDFYADSFCDSCRISFFEVAGAEAFRSPSHVHSEDEILHVVEGELAVGSAVAGVGASIFVPGGVRYAFRTPGPFAFLNYRRDASTCTLRPGTPAFLEAGREGRLPAGYAAPGTDPGVAL